MVTAIHETSIALNILSQILIDLFKVDIILLISQLGDGASKSLTECIITRSSFWLQILHTFFSKGSKISCFIEQLPY